MSAYGTPFTNEFAKCSNQACGHSGRIEFFDDWDQPGDTSAEDRHKDSAAVATCPECDAPAHAADCFGNFKKEA